MADSIEEPAGPAPYSGGSPGFFSGGVYGTAVTLAGLALA